MERTGILSTNVSESCIRPQLVRAMRGSGRAEEFEDGIGVAQTVRAEGDRRRSLGKLATMPEDWIEQRRAGDGERLGWLRPSGEGFVAIDLLGREVSGVVDWQTAEELLENLGIGYLADRYQLLLESGETVRVRLVEVSSGGIRAKTDDFGDMTAQQVDHSLPFPAPESLRSLDR